MKVDVPDFTLARDEELLEVAIGTRPFVTYAKLDRRAGEFVLWRHDVDLSLEASVQLAVLEHRIGLRATYFLHLRSRFYNLLERDSMDRVARICQLGHDIGLHLDLDPVRVRNRGDFEQALDGQQAIVEKTFGRSITGFSYHNPTQAILEWDDFTILGMVKTYAASVVSGYKSKSHNWL